MKPIGEKHPEINLVAIDYDSGATYVNQENRIRLMLSNAKKRTDHIRKKTAVSRKTSSEARRDLCLRGSTAG